MPGERAPRNHSPGGRGAQSSPRAEAFTFQLQLLQGWVKGSFTPRQDGGSFGDTSLPWYWL